MKIKKVTLLPNVITAFSLCCGLFAIFKINMVGMGEVTKELLLSIAGILLLAALADLLDGALARAIKAESEFGGFFDSMADAVNFGVAPALIVLKTLSIPPRTELYFLLTAAAMTYSICGVLRLVRYNVMNLRAVEEIPPLTEQKKYFTGLPIPAAALALISSNLFLFSKEFSAVANLDLEACAWILFFQMIVIGYFMISRWKFPGIKTLHVRVSSFQQVFLIVIFTVFVVFYGLMQHSSLVFVVISWSYILISWVLSLIRLMTGKRAKTLEEFELEPDPLDETGPTEER